MTWRVLPISIFRLQGGPGGYKTFDCPRRTAKSRTGFCTPPGLNQFLSIIFIYSCECGSGKKWSRGDGRGREPGLHRVPGSGRYKSLAAVGRPDWTWSRSVRCVFWRRDSNGPRPLAAGGFPPSARPAPRRTPKSEARFRVAIPEPRFERCCFLEEG